MTQGLTCKAKTLGNAELCLCIRAFITIIRSRMNVQYLTMALTTIHLGALPHTIINPSIP